VGFWDGRRVLLTGAGGFLGSHLADRLRAAGAILITPRRAELDLLHRAATERFFIDARPQLVLHAAVDGGGIGYMREHPGSVLYNNLLMNTHVLHAAHLAGAARFVGVSSVCAYPRDAPVPMREADLWAGYPEPTNGPYGLSKRVLMEQGRAYRAQYGLSVAFPMPTNLYGPRDNFSPERSHVVPALIRRCLEAVDSGAEEIVVWGTGKATRELLYVEDCADAVLSHGGALGQPRAGEHRKRRRGARRRAGRRHRPGLRLHGPPRLGHVQARRPAAQVPRHLPGRRRLRLAGRRRPGRGPTAHRRVVQIQPMSRLRVPALAAALAATLLGGCPERVTWEAKPLDPRFTANAPGSGHQEVKHGDGSAKSDGGGPEHQDVEHNPNAQPPGPFEGVEGPTVKVSGVITAPGDDPIDIDLRAPDPDAPGGNRHLGKIMLSAPGPFEILAPGRLRRLDLGGLSGSRPERPRRRRPLRHGAGRRRHGRPQPPGLDFRGRRPRQSRRARQRRGIQRRRV
jgi:UDP-glucose 4-epimerase